MATRVKGMAQAIARIRKFRADKAVAVERGLKLAGLQLLRASMQLVPVDTGALRASGPSHTGVREGTSGFHTVMEIGYGQTYAIYVHENVFATHPVGQAFYLSQPFREMKDDLIATIAAEVAK